MAGQKTIEIQAQEQIAVIQGLMDKRQELLKELEQNTSLIENTLTDEPVTVNGETQKRSDGRILSDTSLALRLAEILANNGNHSMSVTELTDEAVTDGWQTSSPSPRSIITQALNQDSDFIGKGKRRTKRWKLSAAAYNAM